MTQEDKKLLLKDLCARLPYGVIVEVTYKDGEGWKTEDRKLLGIYEDSQVYVDAVYTNIENVRPYLRPMSSMTDEEKEEMHNLLSPEGTAIYGYDGISVPMNHYEEFVPYKFMNNIIHYLLEHHFDFMALIPKGLAIEVTEENNPYKK